MLKLRGHTMDYFKKGEKFYITTPIYYPSNKLHLGNCYTTVICDAVARFNRNQGKDVFFLTGTDEHGQKVSEAAAKLGKTEMSYLNEIVEDTKTLWQLLNISYDKFIRTTDDYHVFGVQNIFKTLYQKGFIYKGEYKGLYCTPCESFWTESQLVDGKCPDCGREVKVQTEEAYFFKLSAFTDKLLQLYKTNPQFLQPESRVNEMVNNFLKPGLDDLCVSRTSVKWGVPVDFDPKHTVYVWIDALPNYITALGYFCNEQSELKRFWPANVHIIGKEIVRFHAIIWPAILMALDLPLPQRVFGHGWLLFGGDKLSKSKDSGAKDCIDPRVLVPRYSADAIRYILLREIPFGSDGNYTNEILLNRFNSDLVNNFGNLVSRTLSMLKKYFGSVIPEVKEDNLPSSEQLKVVVKEETDKVFKYMSDFDVSNSLKCIFNIFSQANKYIEQTEPWAIAKDEGKQQTLANVMRNLVETIRIGATLLQPFLPDCSQKVLECMSIEHVNFSQIDKFYLLENGQSLPPLPILFPRLDIQTELEALKN